MKFLRQLRNLFRRDRLETEMTEEMRLHVELQTELNRQAGMSPAEARYAALRQFGNVASIQEEAREQRSWLWFEQLGQDMRYAARSLARTPGYAAVAVLTLALGIGATTAIFSVIHGVLLDPYPYARSNEIWAVHAVDAKSSRQFGQRVGDHLEIAQLPGVASAMATSYATATLTGGLNPEVIAAPQVTASAFAFLDVPPVLGRGLGPGDIGADGKPQPVTVLSFGLWQRLFNGDPGVLGKTVVLDDVPHAVVGVMPPRFGWYTNDGLWRLLPTSDRSRWAMTIVRLRPGTSPAVASEQLQAALLEQARKEPDRFPPEGFKAVFRNYLDVTVASGRMRQNLYFLLGAVGCLLLIACTNVANLQLARGAGRTRELAVRLALGAGRGRIGRQLLAESVVLALAGGALGVGLAYGIMAIAVPLLPENIVPNEARVTLNGWVLLFSTVVAVGSGIIAGLVPAWQCTRPEVNTALKDGGQGAGQHRGNRTRNALAVAQVTLSLVLLVGAGLMALGFKQAMDVGEGIQIDRMLLLRVPLGPKRYPEYEQRIAFSRGLLDKVRAVPGVIQATVGIPPGLENGSPVTIPGRPKPSEPLRLNFADAEYLETYGLRLKAGRFFTAAEIERRDQVALVSAAAARLWGEGESPIGRTVEVDALVGGGPNNLAAPGTKKEVTVIGIIEDVYPRGRSHPAPQVITVPYTLRAPAQRTFVIHTAIEPAAVLNTVRAELRAMDKEQPLLRPQTFDEIVEQQAKQPRFNLTLFGIFAVVALVLAASGIYSVLSYGVQQRSREIGVRMALGAEPADVRGLFLRRGAALIGVGAVLGLGLSLALARLMEAQAGVSWRNPVPFVVSLALLALLGCVASLLPARRATKVDPMVVLRAE